MEYPGSRDQDLTVTACTRKFAGMIHYGNTMERMKYGSLIQVNAI